MAGNDDNQKPQKKFNLPNKESIKWSHLFLLIILLIFVVAVSTVGTIIVAAMSGVPSLDDVDISKYSVASYVMDKDGEEAEELSTSSTYIPVEFDDISPNMISALVSIEDKRFYKHPGIDPIRIAGAMKANLQAGTIVQGGSTLTQQLAGVTLLDRDEKTYKRKIQEAIIALKIERHYTKDEILNMYLNRVYFGIGLSGRNCYGVEAAANDFFGKSAKDLSIAESAMLAGMIQNPGGWSPVNSQEKAAERRAVVLDAMAANGAITPEKANASKEAPFNLQTIIAPADSQDYSANQSFVDYVIDEALSVLELDDAGELYTGGFYIYTDLDQELQKYMYDYFNNDYYFPGGAGSGILQGAMVVTNVENGAVRGMIGGRHMDASQERTLNRATQTTRQPGSTFKPIIDYAPAFEKGYGTGSVALDKEYTASSGHVFKNADLQYHGTVTFREAVAQSYNTVAVRVLEEIGVETGIKFAKKLGISTLVEDGTYNDVNLSAAIGGLTEGVTVLDMTGAYGAFASGGVYHKPHAITKITDQDGNLIYEAPDTSKKVMSEQSAYMTTSVLQSVITEGLGAEAMLYDGRPVAGKTGTTDHIYDLWFSGYTPQLAASVWLGYDQQAPIYGQSHITARIFGNIMSYAHRNLEVQNFERPNGLVDVLIDSKTGKLASRSTPYQYRRTEIFKDGTQPTTYSSYSNEWYSAPAPQQQQAQTDQQQTNNADTGYTGYTDPSQGYTDQTDPNAGSYNNGYTGY